MKTKKLLVTGSNGLIGSEMVAHFHDLGWAVHGFDNNMRADFFGPQGDTRWNQERLRTEYPRFTHHELDIRDRKGVLELLGQLRPDAVIHTAAQPSHDLAAARPFDDFDVNAVGHAQSARGDAPLLRRSLRSFISPPTRCTATPRIASS